jgi:hypothetical protein
LRGSSSTTSRRAGSSSITSPTPRVRVPRHVMRLVIDYFASLRLVVDYFSYAARPGASARHAARHRLLCLHRASEYLGTSRGSLSTTLPRSGSSSTTSPTPRVWVSRHITRLVVDYFASRRLVVDYFAYAAPPGALARQAACRRLVIDYFTSRKLAIDDFAYVACSGASACRTACR